MLRYLRTLLLLTACATALALSACGGTAPKPKPDDKPTKPGPTDNVADPFDSFSGEKVELATPFLISNNPIGVKTARLIVKLHNVSFIEEENPYGKKIRDYTAEIEVSKGADTKVLRVPEQDKKWAFGHTFEVLTVEEKYDNDTLKYNWVVRMNVEGK